MKKCFLKILLLLLVFTSSVFAQFSRDDAKQIVTDSISGMMWQDDNAAKTVKKT